MEHEFDHEREHECLHGSIPAYIILDSTTNDRTTTKNCDKIDYWTLKRQGNVTCLLKIESQTFNFNRKLNSGFSIKTNHCVTVQNCIINIRQMDWCIMQDIRAICCNEIKYVWAN